MAKILKKIDEDTFKFVPEAAVTAADLLLTKNSNGSYGFTAGNNTRKVLTKDAPDEYAFREHSFGVDLYVVQLDDNNNIASILKAWNWNDSAIADISDPAAQENGMKLQEAFSLAGGISNKRAVVVNRGMILAHTGSYETGCYGLFGPITGGPEPPYPESPVLTIVTDDRAIKSTATGMYAAGLDIKEPVNSTGDFGGAWEVDNGAVYFGKLPAGITMQNGDPAFAISQFTNTGIFQHINANEQTYGILILDATLNAAGRYAFKTNNNFGGFGHVEGLVLRNADYAMILETNVTASEFNVKLEESRLVTLKCSNSTLNFLVVNNSVAAEFDISGNNNTVNIYDTGGAASIVSNTGTGNTINIL